MAKAKIIASTALKNKRPKTDKKIVILLILNLAVSTVIALKLFGVI